MSKFTFDATKVAPSRPSDPVPKGWYPAVLVSSAIVPTKADPKGGTRLELEIEIIDGEHKGRHAWDGLNLKNKNPKAVQIGEEQLSALCHATGVFKFTDTAELHNKPFEIKLGYEAETEDYDAKNTFKGFRPLEGAAKGAAPTGGGAPAGKAPSWLNKGGNAAPAAGKPTPGKPAGKPAPTPAPEPETPPVDERKFWVFIDNDSQEKTGTEIALMLGQGMPEDTPISSVDDADNWLTAADFEIAPYAEPAAEPEPTPEPTKPKPGPKAPAAPAAAGKTPPWKKK